MEGITGKRHSNYKRLTEEQLHEIEEALAGISPTRRPVCEAIEGIMFKPIDVLDKGFVRVVDYMGDDASVVQGARVSYGKGTRKTSSDRGLIRYLMRHRHTTPFEMNEIKLHIRAPIFVTRQWFRHRTASINEYSARYSVLEREFYVPDPATIAVQSNTNRQGRGAAIDAERAAEVTRILREDASRCYDNYLEMLNETVDGQTIDEDKTGIARELARINLPISIYTQFYWKVNLWNLLRFLSLRADPHAQYEIRAYADAILDLVEKWVPATYESFMDYMLGATELSAQGMSIVKAALSGQTGIDPRKYRLTGRELRDLLTVMPELERHLASENPDEEELPQAVISTADNPSNPISKL